MGYAEFPGSIKHASTYVGEETVGYESLEFKQRAHREIYIVERPTCTLTIFTLGLHS